MGEEPKLCPSCGSRVGQQYHIDGQTKVFWIRCDPIWGCGMEGPKADSKKASIAAWNHLQFVREDEVVMPEEHTEEMEEAIHRQVGIVNPDLIRSFYQATIAARPNRKENEE